MYKNWGISNREVYYIGVCNSLDQMPIYLMELLQLL